MLDVPPERVTGLYRGGESGTGNQCCDALKRNADTIAAKERTFKLATFLLQNKKLNFL